jgi:tRNA(Ile2) C34 agmatinyltransferase TiaS
MEKRLLDTLIALQKRLDMLINLTPTGTERNTMTEENIIALTLINEYEQPNCKKNCGNTQPSGNSDNICLNCGSSIIS